MTVVPLLAMALSKPLFSVYLQHQGFKGANGSEQVVPGFTILFTLYLPAFIAISFFREHGLHTWVRMRVTELRISEIVAAKLSVWAVIGIIQEAMLFLGGWLLLGLRVRGSVAGLSIVASLWILNMCALGIVLVAYCRTSNQVWGLGMTGSLVLAGLGGAIVPRAALPTWAAKISPRSRRTGRCGGIARSCWRAVVRGASRCLRRCSSGSASHSSSSECSGSGSINRRNTEDARSRLREVRSMVVTAAVPFNRPTTARGQRDYVGQALRNGRISGDGPFTSACQERLQAILGCNSVLLTTSCTHALELAAILLDVGPDDEVIVPSFAFVSTANAFVLRGARPVFADVRADTFTLDPVHVRELAGPRTKVIVPLHYGGVACELDELAVIAHDAGASVVEDNAHGLFAVVSRSSAGHVRPPRHAEFPRHEEPHVRRRRRADHQRPDSEKPRRDHPREGNGQESFFSGGGRQVHLG